MNIIKWISGFLWKMSYAYTSLTEKNYLANIFSNSEQPLAKTALQQSHHPTTEASGRYMGNIH